MLSCSGRGGGRRSEGPIRASESTSTAATTRDSPSGFHPRAPSRRRGAARQHGLRGTHEDEDEALSEARARRWFSRRRHRFRPQVHDGDRVRCCLARPPPAATVASPQKNCYREPQHRPRRRETLRGAGVGMTRLYKRGASSLQVVNRILSLPTTQRIEIENRVHNLLGQAPSARQMSAGLACLPRRPGPASRRAVDRRLAGVLCPVGCRRRRLRRRGLSASARAKPLRQWVPPPA